MNIDLGAFRITTEKEKGINSEITAKLDAIDRSQAVIEFDLTGTILTANHNFLQAMGYELDEVVGKHHSIFVSEQLKNSPEYKSFWRNLTMGEFQSGEFCRVNKAGEEVWIQATYNPILDQNGAPVKVIKFASDITEQKVKNAEFEGQIHAINRSQAVIHFKTDGTIIWANDNFLSAMGYTLAEVQGQHHRMFVEAGYDQSEEYCEFWGKLQSGQFHSGEFKRVDKKGNDIWIQASYNPILDANGKPVKVVKFASDITKQKQKTADFEGQLEAISKSQAVIEFQTDGTILNANDNFLAAMGYQLGEIKGRHHSMFVAPEYANSHEYKQFWQKLAKGEFQAAEYKRYAKGNREIWIQATYNPIFDANGKPFKVVKFATDITEQKQKNADFSGQLEAISKSQAVIEFELDGTIRTANENFLSAVGYKLDEIKGQKHALFVDNETKLSAEYNQFWADLGNGQFKSGEFKRINKHGEEFWIQATYNPILDAEGKPFKVVKFASDITAQKIKNNDYEGQIEAIGKSQAVISFNLDGTIMEANQNFLNALGYELKEIQGQHHRMFVDPVEANSHEYSQFWQILQSGKFHTGEYKRITKSGQEIWIQASYNPILDLNGKPVKVVKYATDITEQKMNNANYQGQIEAIGKSQATIEFDLDGNIQTANDNFLNAMGYSLNEIVGRHHSLFVDSELKSSNEYRQFWEDLKRGQYHAGEYKRIDKMGNEVWIQASYNPIMDLNGNPYKVVKYATDVTGRVLAVNSVASSLSALSQGNLNNNITEDFIPEFQGLKDSINETISKLRHIVGMINSSAMEVTTGASEIEKGNADLSDRTEQQASSLEETAASMEQMTSSVRQNADNSKEANTLSSEASEKAEAGGEIVSSAVASMKEISDSSNRINDIIGVIDEIAFQTNLLALNAAVEAARAGEEGRGFAVVATEVRSLAQRSAGAAKEIKELIQDSVKKVEEGTVAVNRSGETLAEIVDSVNKVSEMVSKISDSSAEQAEGIGEINQSISHMDSMTQQNAALVEEASAASQSLNQQSNEMLSQLSFFRMD